MSEKETDQFRRTYIAAGVICLCFMAFSLLFVFHMMKQNEAENMEYLYDAADQNRVTLEKQITGDFQTLEGVAICIGESGMQSDEEIRTVLKKINDNNTFIRMGLADREGRLDLVDLGGGVFHGVDVSGREFFQQAVSGQDAISDTFRDTLGRPEKEKEEDAAYINYYGVPVEKEGDIIGVLCAVNASDMLREIIDTPVLNGKGFSAIIDKQGDFVVRSAHSDAAFMEAASLSEVKGLDETERQAILRKLETGETGRFEYQINGRTQSGVFLPAGVDDWYIFSMVPELALRHRYSQTALGTFIIIAAACLIFLFLLRRQSHLMTRSREVLLRLAYEDSLIGCRNLPKFVMDAEDILRRDEGVHYAVWYCDLKKFKYFNDVFGYEMGDRMLLFLAGVLNQSVGEGGLFCRVGADNFAGMRRYERREELNGWFEELHGCLSKESIGANRFRVELSMGFYCVGESEDRTISVNDMVNRANMAQKSIKQQEGSRCAFFSSEILQRTLKEAELEANGEKALENGKFVVYMQPKVDIQHGNRLDGAEALVRWNSREKGLISPGEFIPLFERTGFIAKLDRCMFEQVCRWFAGYLAEGKPTINVAVNVSRLGMLQEDFVEYYSSVKERFGIPDFCLELEFTESMIMDDEMFKDTVTRMRKKGFVCSMDDFGSGYSSLNLLKNLPIDVLKLDVLFFREGTDVYRERVVISQVIAMARELRIKTIAEGVEAKEQVDFLRSVGCDVVQGFVFAKPMPLASFEKLLDRTEGKEFKVE